MSGCHLSADGYLSACDAMDRSLPSEANTRSKGLSTVHVADLKTGKTRFFCITYKTSAKDPGVALNVCPWCKSKILWRDEDEGGAL